MGTPRLSRCMIVEAGMLPSLLMGLALPQQPSRRHMAPLEGKGSREWLLLLSSQAASPRLRSEGVDPRWPYWMVRLLLGRAVSPRAAVMKLPSLRSEGVEPLLLRTMRVRCQAVTPSLRSEGVEPLLLGTMRRRRDPIMQLAIGPADYHALLVRHWHPPAASQHKKIRLLFVRPP